MAKDKKEKFPEGGIVNESGGRPGSEETVEAIIPLDKLPDLIKAMRVMNPLAEIVKSIAALSQADRLVLYSRLDVIMNHDREKASHGADGGTHLFDEAIKSL